MKCRLVFLAVAAGLTSTVFGLDPTTADFQAEREAWRRSLEELDHQKKTETALDTSPYGRRIRLNHAAREFYGLRRFVWLPAEGDEPSERFDGAITMAIKRDETRWFSKFGLQARLEASPEASVWRARPFFVFREE